MTTGSAVVYAPRLDVDKLEALGEQRINFSVIAHNLPPTASIDGLLGLDFFRSKRLALDFVRGRITLK